MSRVNDPLPPPSWRQTSRMPDRPSGWKLLWRRQRKLVRPVVIGTLVIGAGLAGVYTVHHVGQGASFIERLGNGTAVLGLRVETVVVEGRQKTPEPLLNAAIGATPGAPILTYSLAAARARIETINWVQSATIERRLPGTLIVRLQERSPFAVWQHQGKFALVDRNGELVTDSDVAVFAGQLPLIVGPGAPQAAAALIDALGQHPDLMARVVASVRVGERRWNLRMNNGADILLPEGAEAQALTKLDELEAANALLDRPLQAVDMRLPDRLVVRPVADKTQDKLPDKPGDKDSAAHPKGKPT